MDTLRGQLLVASPSLLDPNFRRSVVLVTEHTNEGAAGLVLNRPSDAAVEDVVPQLDWLAAPTTRVYVGGPVEQSAVLVLAEFDDPSASPVPVFGNLGFVALDDTTVSVDVGRTRVYAGYAGWAGGQLEEELGREDWILEPARADDVFREESEELWESVLRRKGGVYALVARMPENPSVN